MTAQTIAMEATADTPLVSVVIPTYNRHLLLRRALASVLSQTYRNLECLVIDDASTDATAEIVTSCGDNRIRYFKNENNAGAQASRNRGIQEARGAYIGLLDDDDAWLPEKLEKQVAQFVRAGAACGVVYSGFYFVSAKTGAIVSTVMPQHRGDVFTRLLQSCILGSPTPLIRRDCFDRSGLFDEALSSSQDWDMWIRLARHFQFDFVPEILAKHYVHGEQISTSLSSKIASRRALVKKYCSDLAAHPRILSQHYLRIGVLYSLSGDFDQGRRCIYAALKLHPAQASGLAHAALSLIPGLYKKILFKKNVTRIDDITFYY